MSARMVRRSLRARLALTTAVAALLALPGVAAGQATVVGTAIPGAFNPANGGTAATVAATSATEATITLNSKSSVVNWDGFSVTAGNTATFTNASGLAKAAVLNRVTGADKSVITGTIRDQGSGVEVWITNPNGIMFGNGAAINTNGFVATTLPIGDTDFIATTGGMRLQSADPVDQSSITSSGIFNISTNGGVLAVVAPVVQLAGSGTYDARDTANTAGVGQAAFVAATDVTMQNAGSPLAITINRGTTLAAGIGTGQGNALDVAGTVNAGTVMMVVSAQQMVDTLLNVGANVTATATGGNGVVILAGSGAANPDGVSATPSGANVGFSATATTADIGGTGSVVLSGAVNTGSAGAVLGAAGTITEPTGSVTAGGLSAQGSGGVVLTSAANAIGTTTRLASTGGSVSLVDSIGLTVAGGGASGTNVTLAAGGPGR